MSVAEKRKADRSVSPPALKRKVQSTTTKNAVASFFTPMSQKPPEKTTWSIINNSLLSAHHSPSPDAAEKRRRTKRRRIAAFDMDATLIKSISGNKFGRDAQDWTWWDASIPTRLRSLDQAGYQVIIFSNQGGISLPKPGDKAIGPGKKHATYQTKVNAIMNNLDISISLYAATAKDNYRKPRTGMWKEAIEHFDLEGEVDMERSFYVGDAAGRSKDDQKGDDDFASSDRDFATNIGITFHTPEEYFLGHEARSFKRKFDFGGYLEGPSPAPPFSRLNDKDIVLFCGSPGAGKSTFFWTHLKPLGYERINQDTLKTRDRCVKVADNCLQEGKSVAIDNTNADTDVRNVWVSLAKKHNVPIRCVLFKSPPELCEHNDAVRAMNENMNPEKRERLPSAAFAGFKGRFVPPKLEEGFQDITVVEFQFVGDEAAKSAWAQYYV